MRPCEQCVYIRFAMFCIAAGGFAGAIAPKRPFFKIIGYIMGFYGALKGAGFSVTLASIHEAIGAEAPFGVQGCSAVPSFDFGLPLRLLFPGTFFPAGDCGYGSPVVPSGTYLNAVQKFFTDFYADGWYLISKYHFMNMAQASLLYFTICFIVLAAALISKAAAISGYLEK